VRHRVVGDSVRCSYPLGNTVSWLITSDALASLVLLIIKCCRRCSLLYSEPCKSFSVNAISSESQLIEWFMHEPIEPSNAGKAALKFYGEVEGCSGSPYT
jgi:hypothetical protein